MLTLHAAVLAASPARVAALTVPLALFLVLAETTIGGFAVVAYLHAAGGLTRGFLKFMAVTYALLGALALLTVLAGPPRSYRALLPLDAGIAGWLALLQAAATAALILHTVGVWTGIGGPGLVWGVPAAACLLLLAGIAGTLAPLAGSRPDALALTGAVILSALVLGAATTGMLLGHWYLVTPTLTNRPLLRSIVVLLVALGLQALAYPLTLGGLAGSGSLWRPLQVSPTLSILWALGAVLMPLLAAGLAFPTCRLRSFMSTTGLLYLAMIAIIPGQLVGQVLLFVTASG